MRIAGGTAWGLHHFSVTCDLKGDVQRCTRKSRETRGHLARTEAAGAETRGHAAGMECVSNVPGELRHDEPSIRTRHFCRIATPESNPISVSIEAPGDEKTRTKAWMLRPRCEVMHQTSNAENRQRYSRLGSLIGAQPRVHTIQTERRTSTFHASDTRRQITSQRLQLLEGVAWEPR